MISAATTPEEYIASLPDDRKAVMSMLRQTLIQNLPPGFQEVMSYGMISFVVPHSLYPAGYHCNPKQALPFISLASQKNFIALYHMGIYADTALLDWFTRLWPTHSAAKLDMGKSCIRFKKIDQIPFGLLGELASKVTPQQWIATYEANYKK